MSGTPHKMLEHLLDTRLVANVGGGGADPFLDDFLLTHIVFMPVPMLVAKLATLYPVQESFTRPHTFLFTPNTMRPNIP